jgi:thiol-disulfide isomerase/thioredoxin
MSPRPLLPAGRSLAPRLGSVVLALVLALTAGVSDFARAQEISLSCLGGARLNEADLARGTTIIVVWASWSPRSRDIATRVQPLASRWGDRARVLTVNFQEDGPAAERFLAGRNLGAPVCLDPDGAFSRKYNVATLPGLLIVKDGQVAYRGKLPDDPDRVIAGLLR